MRFPFLDSLRGFALVLMAIFHFCFDLNQVGTIALDLKALPWEIFRTVILVLFLALTGAGIALAEPKFSSASFQKRVILLAACAGVISLATRVLFPDQWVFFGVLHLIFVAWLAAPLLHKIPTAICGIAGIAALGIPRVFAMEGTPVILGLHGPRPHTVDFDPIFPWLGVVLLGISLGSLIKGKAYSLLKKEVGFLSLLGKHSLLFYMTHQAILLPLAWLLHFLK